MNAEPPHRPGDRSAPEEGYDIELAPVGLLVAASDGHVIADAIIAELIAIGSTLASCVNIADDMAFSRVAQVVADLDRIVQRLDNSRTQLDQAWGAEPCLGEP